MQRPAIKPIIQLLGTSLLLAGTSLAHARQVDHIDLTASDGIHINNGRIEVSVVNGEYGQASSQTVPFNLRMKAGCKGNDIIKDAFIERGQVNVSENVLEGGSSNFRVDVNRPAVAKSFPYSSATLQVPLNKLGADPVQMCRDMMQEKMSQGVAKHQILNSNHTLNAPMLFTGVASCGNVGNDNGLKFAKDTFTDQLTVICKAGPAAPGGNTVKAPKLPINAVPLGGNSIQAGANALTIVEGELLAGGMSNFVGSCPAQLSMAARVRGGGKGQIRVHVVDGSDKIWESPPMDYDGKQGWKQMNFFYNLPALPQYMNQKKQRSFRLYVELKDENADSFIWSPKGDLDTLSWSHTCKSAPTVPMGGAGKLQTQPMTPPQQPGFKATPGAATPPAPPRGLAPAPATPKPPARATDVKPDEEEPKPAGLLLPAIQKAR